MFGWLPVLGNSGSHYERLGDWQGVNRITEKSGVIMGVGWGAAEGCLGRAVGEMSSMMVKCSML